MSPDGEHPDLGLYLHLPFCERVCPYCDFAVVAAPRLDPARAADYRALLLRELAARRDAFADLPLETVYFGGGTPALFPPAEIERLLAAASDAFSGSPGEVTLEANASARELARFSEFRAAGVTRLSLGAQAFSDETLKRLGAQAFTDETLKRLGRGQSARDVARSLDAARAAGFLSVSVDLIFAAPGQRLADLGRELDLLATWAPEHVSIYELTIEAGTPFALADRRGQLDRADEDEIADMYALVGERLSAWGLERYEISNYAAPGRESQHNRRYWRRQPVLGLGLGAWSLDPPRPDAPFGVRPGNRRELSEYRADIATDNAAPLSREPLRAEQARAEAMFLGLRTREGVEALHFEKVFDRPPRAFFGAAIDACVREGLLFEDAHGNLHMSERGVLVADSVAARFV